MNQLLLDVEFKFHELWDSSFLDVLAPSHVNSANEPASSDSMAVAATQDRRARDHQLSQMLDRFYALSVQKDRNDAGRALEVLLNDLFRFFDLEPRLPFRVQGEEIDGSVILDYQTYLIEAKWTQNPVSERDLLIFRGKVEGKSAFTRGFFISINNFTSGAKESIVRGKQPTFFLVDGYDLSLVLRGHVPLPEMLRFKLRKLTEEGQVFVSAQQLCM